MAQDKVFIVHVNDCYTLIKEESWRVIEPYISKQIDLSKTDSLTPLEVKLYSELVKIHNTFCNTIINTSVDIAISSVMEWCKIKNNNSETIRDFIKSIFIIINGNDKNVIKDIIDEITSVVDNITIYIRDELPLFISDISIKADDKNKNISHVVCKTWDMWVFEIKGKSVLFRNMGDFRIYDWTQRKEEGQFVFEPV